VSYAKEITEARSVIEHLPIDDPGAAAHLLHWAANQLDAVKLGTDLYKRIREPGGKALLEHLDAEPYASEVMCVGTVVRGAMTVLDLCGAVLYRMFAATGVEKGKEADLRWWNGAGSGQRDLLREPVREWLGAVKSSDNWVILKHLRDDYTHRLVRRDYQIEVPFVKVPVRIGSSDEHEEEIDATVSDELGPPGIGPGELHVGDQRIDPLELLPKLLSYAEAQYRGFLSAIEQVGED